MQPTPVINKPDKRPEQFVKAYNKLVQKYGYTLTATLTSNQSSIFAQLSVVPVKDKNGRPR